MKCASCQQILPENANNNFCVYCGQPVTQVCPYEDATNGTRILLLYENERMNIQCNKCKSVFNFCSSCKRLYKLDDTICRTSKCNNIRLSEISKAFPSQSGLLDGTRTAEIDSDFSIRSFDPINTINVENIQSLTYRYGTLIAISDCKLFAYRWINDSWELVKTRILTDIGTILILSVIIDDGKIFILCDDRAIIVTFENFEIIQDMPGRFNMQAKSSNWFCRLKYNEDNNTQLQIYNSNMIDEYNIALPLNIDKISDIIITDKIFVSTLNGEIYAVNPCEGGYDLLQVPSYKWMQLSTNGIEIIAIGRNVREQLTMVKFDMQGNRIMESIIDNSYMHAFSWVASLGKIYLASDNNIATYQHSQITQRPVIVGIPPAKTENMLGLYNNHNQVRLLIKRKSGNHYNILMVDTETGSQVSIGSNMHSSPLMCVADKYIVTAVKDDDTMKLRTFAFGEQQ